MTRDRTTTEGQEEDEAASTIAKDVMEVSLLPVG